VSVSSGTGFFCTARPFTQSLVLYAAYWLHTPKVPLSVAASTSPCNACTLYPEPTPLSIHPKLHLDQFSCFCTTRGRESLYFTMCVKMRLMRDFKKITAAINAIKKLIVLQS